MASITAWLQGLIGDQHSKEEKEIERVTEAYQSSLLLKAQRLEPNKGEKGWTNPSKKAYFANKMEKASEGSPYTFQVTTKANCYESVLEVLEKGEPKRHYAE